MMLHQRQLRFLSRNDSGLAISVLVFGLGSFLWILGDVFESEVAVSAARVSGAGFLFVALPLLFGSVYHLCKVSQAARLYPPPGQLVKVNGTSMHLLAEGPRSGAATVVWISGKHDQGLVLHHLHKRTRHEYRSIIFDRPGSGWSDTGSFPRSVVQEANELQQLLHAAGESGPFILVPWSFSGLLATTFSELFPTDVAGLVLLDVTAGAYPVFDRKAQIASMCRQARISAWRSRFGLEWNPRAKLSTEARRQFESLYSEISDVHDSIIANNAQPRFHHTTHSALISSAEQPFGATHAKGALGELPIFVVVPDDCDDQAVQVANLYQRSEFERSNARRYSEGVKRELADLSTTAEIRRAPQGTTHSFPFEAPIYVIEQVVEMILMVGESSNQRTE